MISRPGTDQILLECRRELLESILPAIDDDPTKVRVMMLEHVLRNAATRAAHEIAWMNEESKTAIAYAESVRGALDAQRLSDALGQIGPVPPESLHLEDVTRAYDRASEALADAIEAAMAAGDKALTE